MTEQKEVLEEFKGEINNQIVCFQKDIRHLNQKRKEYETYLINSSRNLELKRRQVEDLKKFSKDVNQTIKEQVEEIKQLPFVSGVKFTTKGISIDIGKVDINYRNNNVYIGDFTILITPSGIKLNNRNPVYDEYENKLEHPHINSDDGHICYGSEREIKINEYFGKFQLRQLVYMVYLFLKTYSERDKYNPITYWTQEAKRKDRKTKIIKENNK